MTKNSKQSQTVYFGFITLITLLFASGNLFAQSPYCAPQYTTGCGIGDQIESFSTLGGTTNISNLNSGCSSGYYSFINNQEVTVVNMGSFEFTVASGSAYNQGFRIWIDWNEDNDFNDPGEDMWNSGIAGSSFTDSLTAPQGAAGTFRMRVRCDFSGVPTDPCAQQSYGETEDYLITVLPGAPDDGGVASIDDPKEICEGEHDVIATIENFGTEVLNFVEIHWTVGGIPQPTVNHTTPIDTIGGTGSTTAQVNLGTFNFNDPTYDEIVVWTENPNGVADTVNYNDTVREPVDIVFPNMQVVNTSDVSCFGDMDGTALVEAVSGKSPFDFTWSSGDTGTSVNDLGQGTYQITMEDDLGCLDTAEITISEPAELEFTIVDSGSVSCYDRSDGFAEIQAVGGVQPYDYFWYDGSKGTKVEGLPAGNYGVTITDDDGCVGEQVLEIEEPEPLILTEEEKLNVACHGENSGQIQVSASGGTTPYTFSWNTGDTTSELLNLAGGKTYTVTLIDENGCQDEESFFISEPNPLDDRMRDHSPQLLAEMDWPGTEYSWYDCENNVELPDENSDRFVPEDNGSYALIVSYQGCSDTADCVEIGNVSTTDRAGVSYEFDVYPNPNSGAFSVNLSGFTEADVEMQVVDLQGKILLNRSLGQLNGELREELNLNLASGVYFVKVMSEGNLDVKRIVVK